ncbi:MAG TPA: pyrroline-5-carboxylate reductase [Gammaproteobacteria bacterium]
MMDVRVLLIGFGNMGQALVKGWLDRGVPAAAIRVVDPAAGALEAAVKLGVARSEAVDAGALAHAPGVVLLAVKPGQLEEALRACTGVAAAGPLFLSIAAGKPIASITRVLGGDTPVVRAMPNTPAAVGRGMTVLTASPRVSAPQRAAAEALMAAVGEVAWVDDETLMDAVTAVSGSGPAYVFLLIECLTRAGTAAGLDGALAEKLATVTVAGAGAYAAASGEPAAELRRRVTSPGGTTEAALRILAAADGLPDLLERAVRAAAERSRELSQE